MNAELPKGWVWTSIGEVTENPQYGWTTRATTEGNAHLLRTTDITSGKIDWSSVPYCEEEPENIEKYLLKEGDIVISRAGSVGYSYLLDNPQNSIFASYLIRFKPLINNFFLSYFLKSPIYWEAISEKSIGIAMANVNASKLKQIEMPLPPLAEQQRIVSKIEELFTNLDKGVESLKEVKSKLKIYRQAILKYAIEGKLTEKWREENKDKIEPTSVLLERIKEKIKKTENRELPPSDTSKLIKLPDGWEWVRLGEIVSDKITKGSTPTSYGFSYVDSGIKFIKTENIDEKGNVQEKTDFIDTKTNDFLKRSQLQNKDILFSIAGTIGRIGIVEKKDLPANTNQALAIIRCFWNMIENKYIFYILKSSLIQTKASNSIVGVGRANVSLTDIGFFQIPLPPLEEQNIIVERIEQLFSLADYIEETVDSKLEQSKNLRKSILKKAFEGKLVPQDPNDEPAGILLEKIKKQRLNKEKLVQEKLI